MAYTE